MPKQMKQDKASIMLMKSLGPASSTVNTIMYSNLAVNLVMSASLQMLWSMINVMQLIVKMPLLNITFPQNAATFYTFINEISSFNLIPTDKLDSAIFNFTDPEMQDPNFAKMGITKYNVV